MHPFRLLFFHSQRSWERLFVASLLCAFVAANASWAQAPEPVSDAAILPYFDFPATDTTALVSFDWDAVGNLNYTVGDPNWGLKLEVYRHGAPTDTLIYQSDAVWFGSALCAIGNQVYFNDGGNLMRSDYNYYCYPASGVALAPLLAAPYGASLWGLATRHANEFFASGSETTWGPAALFYGALDPVTGLLASGLTKFADIGESPGPMTFDPDGNLYYAHGYVFGTDPPALYRWTAAEVAAALADPVNAALSGLDHQWAELPTSYTGATGMTADSEGNIFVTATSWSAPSRLVAYRAEDAAPFPVAESSGRLETVRFRDNSLFVSCAAGVFEAPTLHLASPVETTTCHNIQGETVLLSATALGGVGDRHYQWHRLGADKSMTPVGDDSPHYSFTADMALSGTEYVCVISDALYTVESPTFVVMVQMPTPAASVWLLLAGSLLLLTVGVLCLGFGAANPATTLNQNLKKAS